MTGNLSWDLYALSQRLAASCQASLASPDNHNTNNQGNGPTMITNMATPMAAIMPIIKARLLDCDRSCWSTDLVY